MLGGTPNAGVAMLAMLLAAALAASPQKIAPLQKIEMPKPTAPDLSLSLPDLPKAEGLEATPKPQEAESRRAPSDLSAPSPEAIKAATASILSVDHARDFLATSSGYKAVGGLEAIRMGKLPAQAPAFKTRVRISSDDGAAMLVRAAIRSPANEEIASSRAEVSFAGVRQLELVIDWDGFPVHRPGDHRVVLTLDGSFAGEYPLAVTGR